MSTLKGVEKCVKDVEIPFDSADEETLLEHYSTIGIFCSSRIFIVYNITFVETFFRFKLGQITFGSTSITTSLLGRYFNRIVVQ